MFSFNLSFFHGPGMSSSAQSSPSALTTLFTAIMLLEMAIRNSHHQPLSTT